MAVFTHGVSSFHASHKVFPNFTFQMTSIFKIIIRNFVSSSRHLENAIKTSEMTSFRRFVVSGTRRSHAHIGPMFGSQMNHHSGCSATQSSNNCRAVITSSVSFCLWPIKVSPNRTFHFVTNIFKLVNKPTQRINEYLQWANFATLEFYGGKFVDILANSHQFDEFFPNICSWYFWHHFNQRFSGKVCWHILANSHQFDDFFSQSQFILELFWHLFNQRFYEQFSSDVWAES